MVAMMCAHHQGVRAEHGGPWQQAAECRTRWTGAMMGWGSRYPEAPDRGGAPVAVLRESLWWLLNILCSWYQPCSHPLREPEPSLAPTASAGAGPDRPSGLLHLPSAPEGRSGPAATAQTRSWCQAPSLHTVGEWEWWPQERGC